MQTITNDIKAILNRPLPAEAVTPHPSKTYLSSIKSIYVTERLNEAFGEGAWQTKVEHITTDRYLVKRKIDGKDTMVEQRMVVVKLQLDIPSFGIHYESFGGNDNEDLGDAYKGASTDALTKICSWLGIGADVFKGLQTGKKSAPRPAQPAPTQPSKTTITNKILDDNGMTDKLLQWMWKKWQDTGFASNFDAGAELAKAYHVEVDVLARFCKLFESFSRAMK